MNRTAHRETSAETIEFTEDEDPLRILLGEDNLQMRKLLGMILRREGHDVVETRDGAELLEALSTVLLDDRRPRFDLIISEGSLPGIPGLAILAGLRVWDRATPFVLITGSPDVQKRARDLGAVILEPPINVRAIRGALQSSADYSSYVKPAGLTGRRLY